MKKLLFFSLLLFTVIAKSQQKTYVPDNNFEQELINLGYDDILDDYILTENINKITNLIITHKNIKDLTGIESFTSLEVLICSYNNIKDINLESNTLLKYLYCDWNDLESLDLESNTLLKELNCQGNKLKTLNLESNTGLEELQCRYNYLKDLNLNSEALEGLQCSYNLLTSLDLNSGSKLKLLSCEGNNLLSLDLSINTQLESLYCQSNKISNLNIRNSNNSLIGTSNFVAYNNPDLECIQVDDVNYSIVNWTNVDEGLFFSENCSETLNSIPVLNEKDGIRIINNKIEISQSEIKITIYNSIGQKVANENLKGIYLLKLINNVGKIETIRLVIP